MAAEFSAGLATTLAQYCDLARNDDRDALRLHLHSLKGTAATLGAMPLSLEAARLEKLCRGPVEEFAPMDHVDALQAVLVPTQQVMLAAIDAMEQAQEDVAPSQDAARGPVNPAQRAQAHGALDELIALLNANDLTVLERFGQLRGALSMFAPAQLADLDSALMGLSLEQAGRLCTELKASV
jgi:HPt (histidine-containing phosphotransfer) domain-containing protein